MIIHGITSSDLLAAYIDKYHHNMNVMVVHLNVTSGCQRLLGDIKDQLLLAIPDRIEHDSDYIMIGSHREELTKFINAHDHPIYDTRLELYIDGCLYMTN